MSNGQPAFRLAFRQEGKFWNCYLAPMGTMEGAQLIGSLSMTLAPIATVQEAFVATMKLALNEALKAIDGTQVVGWNTQQAPEHECAWNA